MTASFQSLLSETYLRAVYDKEFQTFLGSPAETLLVERLKKWASKGFQKETTAESAFVSVFFEDIWGYISDGKQPSGSPYTLHGKFALAGSGAGGNTGLADAALGHFSDPDVPGTAQVICEYKDVRSNLDAPQKRKGNNRSPVKQCADYLREAMRPLYGNEAVQPTWGIVSDMNEFRLYWRNTMPSQYQRFVIRKATTDEGVSLLDPSEAGSFQRFLFSHLLHVESLLSKGGPSRLLRLLQDQRYREKEIENKFYREYKAFREHLVKKLIEYNSDFAGTKGRLVRLAQKLIDRCIFVMFCEDMGEQLSFPPNALRDYLAELSKSTTFEAEESDAWNKLKELFQAMNEGKKFRARALNRFNGGLFAPDAELEQLQIPNDVFCAKLQGESNVTLQAHPLTLVYFAGNYNFGKSKEGGRAVTLFTLGRIFEQSITELEALEAEVENKPSLTVLSRRKRDGVFYTPEWIVERVVAETLGPRLDDIRRAVGWIVELEGDESEIAAQLALAPSKRSVTFRRHVEGVRVFRERLKSFTVLDPACGSGAFLIHTLEYLLRERRRAEREYRLCTEGKGVELFEFQTDEAIRSILSANIFGVDINPASVEIARLALWLHTAKSDQPLTNLDGNIVAGNSLVGPQVYELKKDLLGASQIVQATINAFDFPSAFPAVFTSDRPNGAGFDCVIGNPPYVKLQNFKRVYPDTAAYLKEARGVGNAPLYESCQTGAPDLYLPFIEHALTLLNKEGRLGYIAPSVWRFNDYGRGLRKLIKKAGALDRWIDFGSYQVFEEATTYTALQFYSRQRNSHLQFALCPDGALASIPDWDDDNWRMSYDELADQDAWILASRPELNLLKKLAATTTPLGKERISQGIISGASTVFIGRRIEPNTYEFAIDKEKLVSPVEDDITKRLISATEIDRFIIHEPSDRIIFPYDTSGSHPKLFALKEMRTRFPKALIHLESNESFLRKRDDGQFSQSGDQADGWYAFSRNQNLDRQNKAKIVIAGTGTRIEAALDAKGVYAANDKRVYSVFPRSEGDLVFLVGVLNCRVATFVFRHSARPKDNGYYDVETQFLTKIPIPKASDQAKEEVANHVETLIKLHSKYRSTLTRIAKLASKCEFGRQPEEWLWPGSVRSAASLKAKASSKLTSREKTTWAKAERSSQIDKEHEKLGQKLKPLQIYAASYENGELSICASGALILDGVFVSAAEAPLIVTSWNAFLRQNPPMNGKEFAEGLLKIIQPPNDEIGQQLIDCEVVAASDHLEIKTAEDAFEQYMYGLYELTSDEIKLVEDGSR